MPRLFIAIELPDDITQKLAQLKTSIPTAKWVNLEHVHLTMRFIGAEVPDAKVDPIKTALSAVNVPAFDLTVSGVGRFPPGNRKAPRVLWAGIEKQPRLLDLHRQIEQVLDSVGFPPEDQAFSPHITLARLKSFKPVPEADAFLERHRRFEAGTFDVTEFKLIRSVLSSQGPTYSTEAVYELKG